MKATVRNTIILCMANKEKVAKFQCKSEQGIFDMYLWIIIINLK